MKRMFLLSVIVLCVGAIGFSLLNTYIYTKKQGDGLPADYKDVTFFISGEPVTMQNGYAEAVTDLGGASKTIVRYFGNELRHDIDGDGVDDVVFLITQDTGGSGTFFYLVGALKRVEGYEGTHAVFIGDRIAPQSTTAGEGRQVVVNYADRAPGEPMAAQPSVGKSLYLLLDTATREFGEVVQNFEGESAR